MNADYRINYVIERRLPGEDDFTEIGFGSSGVAGDPDACAYDVESAVQNRLWETEPGQPDPSEVAR